MWGQAAQRPPRAPEWPATAPADPAVREGRLGWAPPPTQRIGDTLPVSALTETRFLMVFSEELGEGYYLGGLLI